MLLVNRLEAVIRETGSNFPNFSNQGYIIHSIYLMYNRDNQFSSATSLPTGLIYSSHGLTISRFSNIVYYMASQYEL